MRDLGYLVRLRLLRVEELGEGGCGLRPSQQARSPLCDLLLARDLCGWRWRRAVEGSFI